MLEINYKYIFFNQIESTKREKYIPHRRDQMECIPNIGSLNSDNFFGLMGAKLEIAVKKKEKHTHIAFHGQSTALMFKMKLYTICIVVCPCLISHCKPIEMLFFLLNLNMDKSHSLGADVPPA